MKRDSKRIAGPNTGTSEGPLTVDGSTSETIYLMARKAKKPKASSSAIETKYVLFDLAEVRYRDNGEVVTAYTPLRERVGTSDTLAAGRRETYLAALDDAICRGVVWRDGVQYRIAFYNPHTAEVSLGPSWKGRAFRFPHPVALERGGNIVTHVEDGEDSYLVLEEGVVATQRPVLTITDIGRLLASNREGSVRAAGTETTAPHSA